MAFYKIVLIDIMNDIICQVLREKYVFKIKSNKNDGKMKIISINSLKKLVEIWSRGK